MPARASVLLLSVLLAVTVARNPTSLPAILAFAIALCLTVPILAYRAAVDATYIHIRYLPFWTSRTPTRDVTQVLDERTLVLVSETARIPLWGLPLAAREPLFEILPRRFNVQHSQPSRPAVDPALIRRMARLSVIAGLGFVASLAALTLVLAGFPLHRYWESVGKYLIFPCMGFLTWFLLQAVLTYSLWSANREIEGIARERSHAKKRSA